MSKTDANKNNVEQSAVTNGTKEKHKRNHTEVNDETIDPAASELNDLNIKKARILDKIRYDDLECEEEIVKGPSQLNLVKVERYLHGPIPVPQYESSDDTNQLDSVQYQLLNEINGWSTRTPHKVLVSPTAAVNALGELSPGGALMRGFQEQSLARKFNFYISIKNEMIKLFIVCRISSTGCAERIEKFIFIVK